MLSYLEASNSPEKNEDCQTEPNNGAISFKEFEQSIFASNNYNINNNGKRDYVPCESSQSPQNKESVKIQIQPEQISGNVQINTSANRDGTTANSSLKKAPSLRERFSFQNILQRIAQNRLNHSKSTTSALPVAVKKSSNYSSRRQSATSRKGSEACLAGPSSKTSAAQNANIKAVKSFLVERIESNQLEFCPICYDCLSYQTMSAHGNPSTSSAESNRTNDGDCQESDHLNAVKDNDHSDLPSNQAVTFSDCRHVACLRCWCSYVVALIENYQMAKMACLVCKDNLHFHQLVHILKLSASVFNKDTEYANKLIQRYDNFLLYRALAMEPHLRWCPSGGCGYAVIAPDREACPALFCERIGCQTVFCYRCRDFWHANSCKENSRTGALPKSSNDHREKRSNGWRSGWFRRSSSHSTVTREDSVIEKKKKKKKRKKSDVFSRESSSDAHGRDASRFDDLSVTKIEDDFDSTINSDSSHKNGGERGQNPSNLDPLCSSDGDIKRCPRCHSYVLKMDDGTCNHMVCIVCGCEFCWLCMKEITDMHYLSPSGCTFWGRKQWTVEKRILWQLGTLLGAPIGIGFLAAIAVPAIIIGIPIYTAMHIKKNYKTDNKHKRRLAVVSGAFTAFVLSPIAAGLTVGLGVPLMMAYVYIVMPMALCKASFCARCESQNVDSESIDIQLDNDKSKDLESGMKLETVTAVADCSDVAIQEDINAPNCDNGGDDAQRVSHCVSEGGGKLDLTSVSINCTTSERNVLKVTADIVHSSESQGANAPIMGQLESSNSKNCDLYSHPNEDSYCKHYDVDSVVHANQLSPLKFGLSSVHKSYSVSHFNVTPYSDESRNCMTWPRDCHTPATLLTQCSPPLHETRAGTDCPPTPYTHLQYCPHLPRHTEEDKPITTTTTTIVAESSATTEIDCMKPPMFCESPPLSSQSELKRSTSFHLSRETVMLEHSMSSAV